MKKKMDVKYHSRFQ